MTKSSMGSIEEEFSRVFVREAVCVSRLREFREGFHC